MHWQRRTDTSMACAPVGRREQEHQQKMHRERISNIKSAIDSTAPKPQPHLTLYGRDYVAKKRATTEAAFSDLKMIQSIARTMTRQAELPARSGPVSLNAGARKAEIYTIMHENHRLLNSLENLRPMVSTQDMEKNHMWRQRHVINCSHSKRLSGEYDHHISRIHNEDQAKLDGYKQTVESRRSAFNKSQSTPSLPSGGLPPLASTAPAASYGSPPVIEGATLPQTQKQRPKQAPKAKPVPSSSSKSKPTSDETAPDSSTNAADATLKQDAKAGDKILQVSSQSGVAVGQSICINPGGKTEEVCKVAGFGSILLESGLQYAHKAGEKIVPILDRKDSKGTARIDPAITSPKGSPVPPTPHPKKSGGISLDDSQEMEGGGMIVVDDKTLPEQEEARGKSAPPGGQAPSTDQAPEKSAPPAVEAAEKSAPPAVEAAEKSAPPAVEAAEKSAPPAVEAAEKSSPAADEAPEKSAPPAVEAAEKSAPPAVEAAEKSSPAADEAPEKSAPAAAEAPEKSAPANDQEAAEASGTFDEESFAAPSATEGAPEESVGTGPSAEAAAPPAADAADAEAGGAAEEKGEYEDDEYEDDFPDESQLSATGTMKSTSKAAPEAGTDKEGFEEDEDEFEQSKEDGPAEDSGTFEDE